MLLLTLVLLSSITPAGPSVTEACAYDQAAIMALTPDAFDQDLKGGWRPLADKAQCRKAAADLLRSYREAHRATMTAGEVHISYWHEGQMRAEAGDNREAASLLLAGVDPGGEFGFEDYALGTVAFLLHDRPALLSARARLAVLPQPADWAQTQATVRAKAGFAPGWPPNLDVLDGLLACFDKPYAQAYLEPCRPRRAGES